MMEMASSGSLAIRNGMSLGVEADDDDEEDCDESKDDDCAGADYSPIPNIRAIKTFGTGKCRPKICGCKNGWGEVGEKCPVHRKITCSPKT